MGGVMAVWPLYVAEPGRTARKSGAPKDAAASASSLNCLRLQRRAPLCARARACVCACVERRALSVGYDKWQDTHYTHARSPQIWYT